MLDKILIAAVLVHQICPKLISIIEFARHGARHYRDPNETASNVELTEFGYQQNILYGSKLKETYPEIFNKDLEISDVRVVTSHRMRCAYSALGQLTKIFEHKYRLGENNYERAKSEYKELISTYDIDVLSKEENIIFKPHLTDCKYLSQLKRKDIIEEQRVSSFYNQLLSHYKRQDFNASKYLEDRTNEIHHFSAAYDLVHSFQSFNTTHPLDEETINYMRALKMFIRSLEKYYDPRVSAFYVQNILIELLSSFDEILTNYTRGQPYKKFALFVGHDSNIVPLLHVFKLTSIDCLHEELSSYKKLEESESCRFYPDFLANFIFELHQEGTRYYVVGKYNGEEFKLCNNRVKCPLFDFRRLILGTLQRNYAEFCVKGTNTQLQKQKAKNDKLNKGMLILACIVATLIVIRRIREGKIFNE